MSTKPRLTLGYKVLNMCTHKPKVSFWDTKLYSIVILHPSLTLGYKVKFNSHITPKFHF